MNLAIIGAGMAGLSAARELRWHRPDLAITIYEKSRGLGGRVATRRRDGAIFDHGAQVIKASDEAMRQLLTADLPSDGLRRVERPVWVLGAAGERIPGDPALNAEQSWTYAGGINHLGKLLGDGLDIRRETRVAALRREPGTARWALFDATGVQLGTADAVLLTPPAPQTAEIVAASDLESDAREMILAELSRVPYRRCLTLTLAYDRLIDRPFYALINVDRRHPIAWLALEHTKGPERCPPGHSLIIVQMAGHFSMEHWNAPVDELALAVIELASVALGEDVSKPLWYDRQGWRYALPDGVANSAALNATRTGLFFAGDYTVGLGRIHLAIASGRDIAETIMGWM